MPEHLIIAIRIMIITANLDFTITSIDPDVTKFLQRH